MTLIRTGLLNSIAVAIKMLTLLGVNKVLAIYVGPGGYAALGQFQNAIQMITTFASGAVNTGVTKYTAEYVGDHISQRKVWGTAGTIALIGSLLSAFIIIFCNKTLSSWFLSSEGYGGVFICFAVSLVFFSFNALLLAVLNGRKEIATYVLANIAGSIFSLVITAFMAMNFGLYGALIALAVYQSFAFVVTLALCYRAPWFRVSYFFSGIDAAVALNLSKYALMAFTSAACVPVSHILVRDYLGETFGLQAAGYWEAMWRLSAAYLMLVTTTLSVYYLPRLSELKGANEIRSEIVQGYRVILPIAIVSALIIYLMRDFIIVTLFTGDFSPMRELFAWQMLGDTLKIGGWVLAYLMLGKAMMKLFICSEVIFAAGFVAFTWGFTKIYGFQGVAIAHAVNYFLYWLVMAFFIWRKLVDRQGFTENKN
ncbi:MULTISPECIES: O-antigen translocase [unclassified Pseudomonas]|jgi:PST family polysaccharide transporter|uniref:O-antigen translocase n=1 Tax=unclassified Pseudomonas TaxID=196821 RepID=UPI0008BC7A49|nr:MULTISPECIES: O-antigen translocase [unclassified Pseudomonas]PMV17881.1 O-antigen translocase [Pseudomonas sp. FW305-3-2-15-C-TSA2]PMV24121.1 O-antigen translocase [Pseudomonas sp. DP16D-L5]PMV37615.1 O-antigen translocase [Pseudomonas sp. FW305-3-2-15-A-LB2]PMV42107.1 O-antigen translocase [Pseudomonas sp. FW305-3-2-15-C-R2A1]PMV47935.1 O-antigen translocase [Pseudomonas sp. FW305-3-2-15-C-LB1]